MKKLIVSLLIVATTTINAQRKPMMSPEKKVEIMTQKLNLSDAQASQIKIINTKYAPEEQELHNEMKSLHQANQVNYQKEREEIKAVLTPEQQAKKREMMKNHLKGNKTSPSEMPKNKEEFEDKMQSELNLSDKQMAQIKDIRDKYKDPKMEACKDKMKKLHKEKREEIKAVLTPEQLETFQKEYKGIPS